MQTMQNMQTMQPICEIQTIWTNTLPYGPYLQQSLSLNKAFLSIKPFFQSILSFNEAFLSMKPFFQLSISLPIGQFRNSCDVFFIILSVTKRVTRSFIELYWTGKKILGLMVEITVSWNQNNCISSRNRWCCGIQVDLYQV